MKKLKHEFFKNKFYPQSKISYSKVHCIVNLLPNHSSIPESYQFQLKLSFYSSRFFLLQANPEILGEPTRESSSCDRSMHVFRSCSSNSNNIILLLKLLPAQNQQKSGAFPSSLSQSGSFYFSASQTRLFSESWLFCSLHCNIRFIANFIYTAREQIK